MAAKKRKGARTVVKRPAPNVIALDLTKAEWACIDRVLKRRGMKLAEFIHEVVAEWASLRYDQPDKHLSAAKRRRKSAKASASGARTPAKARARD